MLGIPFAPPMTLYIALPYAPKPVSSKVQYNIHLPPIQVQPAQPLFDLLRLELDRLSIDKDALALVRLRSPPLPDLRSKLHHDLLFRAFEQDSRRLRRAGFDALGDSQLDGM
jgi:hypothetical protein